MSDGHFHTGAYRGQKRSEEATTVAAVAKALAGNHPPDVERALIRIAARAVERGEAERNAQPTVSDDTNRGEA